MVMWVPLGWPFAYTLFQGEYVYVNSCVCIISSAQELFRQLSCQSVVIRPASVLLSFAVFSLLILAGIVCFSCSNCH